MENIKQKLEEQLKQAEKWHAEYSEKIISCDRNQLGDILAMADFYSGMTEGLQDALNIIEEELK